MRAPPLASAVAVATGSVIGNTKRESMSPAGNPETVATTFAPTGAWAGLSDTQGPGQGWPRAVPGTTTSEPIRNVKNSTKTEYLRLNFTTHLKEGRSSPQKKSTNCATPRPRVDRQGTEQGPC